MLVTALLNLVALLIRSVLSRAFAPPVPDAAGTFSAAGEPRWSRGQNTPSGSHCWGEAWSQTESAEIDVWLTSHGRSEDSLQLDLKTAEQTFKGMMDSRSIQKLYLSNTTMENISLFWIVFFISVVKIWHVSCRLKYQK